MATHQTDASVEEFLAQVPEDQRREDARRLCVMMREITGEPPVMWGLDDVDLDALRELIDRSVRIRKGINRASG